MPSDGEGSGGDTEGDVTGGADEPDGGSLRGPVGIADAELAGAELTGAPVTGELAAAGDGASGTTGDTERA